MFISVYLSISSRFFSSVENFGFSHSDVCGFIYLRNETVWHFGARAVLLSSRIPWVDDKKIVCFLCRLCSKKKALALNLFRFHRSKMSLIDSRDYLHTYWIPSIFISGENDFVRLFHIHAQALSASLLPYSLQIPYTIVCDASSNVRDVDRSESAPLSDRVEINKALDHWSKPRYLQCTSSKNKFFIFLFLYKNQAPLCNSEICRCFSIIIKIY